MKVRVRCALPNASANIGGFAFERQADGAMLSEEMDRDAAENFARIPGYDLEPLAAPEKEAPADEAEAKTEARRPRGKAAQKNDD